MTSNSLPMLVVAIVALLSVGCSELVERSAPAASVATDTALPLEQLLGFSSLPRSAELHYARLQSDTDESVVACMANQGLRFVPSAVPWLSDTDGEEPETRAWAERNGLGITESFRRAQDQLQQADPRLDPNATYLSTLNDTDRAAWNEALYGDISNLGDTSQGSVAYEPGGCQGAAFALAFKQNQLFEQFGDEVSALDARVVADLRVVGFMDQWSACMQGLGYDYTDAQAMSDDVYASLLVAAESPSGLDELAAFEQSVAVASYDCRAPFADDVFAIRAAYEREFINDNRPRIDAAVHANGDAVGAP